MILGKKKHSRHRGRGLDDESGRARHESMETKQGWKNVCLPKTVFT